MDGNRTGGNERGGALHLSSILPALSASIGTPVATRVHRDPESLRRTLGFPQARSAIVVLVDGMGYWNINLRRGHAPYLRSLMGHSENQRPIATCAPSTTVAAMATFGTGTCPGMTGMAGYTERNPNTGGLCQLIQFRDAPGPEELQREPTVFELLAAKGVRVTSSGLPKFAFSPLTRAALRGTHYVSGGSPRQRVLNACKAAEEPGLIYLYIRDADKTGHNYGWHSDRWIAAFESIDAQLALLRRFAPKGTLIVITADHGMIQTDPEARIDVAEHGELGRGVALVGGEPRSVMLYAEPDEDPEAIAGRWRDFLGDRAEVRTKAEAIGQGMFGPVEERVEPVLGDVLVSAASRVTIVDSRTQSDAATRLPSVHGSLTHMESDIPCLIDMA
ncbi:alkaline phosphatase family protein [Bifidobacterium sp. ESL0763]|nr:alkaline phosphatase family protein [Bifidobacterium sp. ESL0763]MDF7664064.1 alkaline phosphatase family protein [Bifidobacterium sp. ESL0763]